MTRRWDTTTWWAAASTVFIVLIAVLASLGPVAAEQYVESVYPPLTHALVLLGSSVPGSVTSITAILTLVALAAWAWRRPPGRVVGLATSLLLLGLVWGLAAWGVHYRRAPVSERLGLAATATAAERERLQSMLLATIASTTPADAIDEVEAAAATAAIARSLSALSAELEGWDLAIPEGVVLTPPGSLLLFGTSGIVSPWWLEAHVDGGLPPAARIAVAAHELAHLGGWAREDEAEALGALAAWRAGDPNARYAAALFQTAGLAGSLPPVEREALLDSLPPRARDDLRAAARASDAYRNALVARLSRSIYDHYLRAQGVDEGIRSYAAATDLLARLAASDPDRLDVEAAPESGAIPTTR